MKKRTYIYKGFERFWHWTQALLIMFLAVTGFEIHASYNLMGYENAVNLHDISAWMLLILIVFAIFWHLAVGEWKQYVPSSKLVKEQIEYYITGIFRGAPHPTKKTSYNKFNPLQRLTYFGFKALIIPLMVFSGILYMFPGLFPMLKGSSIIPVLHTLGAFVLIAFLIAHLYLLSTNHNATESIVAMITGWEELHVDPKEEHKKHMQKAVDKSIAGYYRVNKSGIFMDVNKAWLRMHKYASSDEVLGKHFAMTRDAKDLKDLEDTFNRVLAGETVIGKPVMRKCNDGSYGKHVLSMNPTLEGDVITGVEGFIIDLPDVGALQPQMDNIVRNSNAGYYRIDKNGYIVEVNDAWLAMYKCKDKESIIGKHFSVTRDEKNLGRLNEIFNNVLKNGATITSEVARRRCSDGSLGKHILSANPVYEGSEIIGMEGFILDISNLDDVNA